MSQLAFPGPWRSTGHWTKASCRWKSIPDLVNTPVKQTIVIWKPVTLTANIETMTRMSESLNGFTNVLNGTGRRRKQTCPGKSSLAFDKENSANWTRAMLKCPYRSLVKNKCIWKKKLYSPVTTFREVHKYPWALGLPAVSLEKLPKSVRLTGNSWELTALQFSKSDSRVTFCPWCLARLGNHAKGYNKRLHCIASACGSPSFHRYLRSVMPNYCLSFVAPTTVSMEMTWHFFEFRMKHLSAKGEEYSCNLHWCSAAGYLA